MTRQTCQFSGSGRHVSETTPVGVAMKMAFTGDRDFRSGCGSQNGSGRHARLGPRRQATVNLIEMAAASRRRLRGVTRLLGTL